MSELVLNESTEDVQISSDDELNLINRLANSTPYKRMIGSSGQVNKRLLK